MSEFLVDLLHYHNISTRKNISQQHLCEVNLRLLFTYLVLQLFVSTLKNYNATKINYAYNNQAKSYPAILRFRNSKSCAILRSGYFGIFNLYQTQFYHKILSALNLILNSNVRLNLVYISINILPTV